MQTLLEMQSAWTIANGDEQKPAVGSTVIQDWEN